MCPAAMAGSISGGSRISTLSCNARPASAGGVMGASNRIGAGQSRRKLPHSECPRRSSAACTRGKHRNCAGSADRLSKSNCCAGTRSASASVRAEPEAADPGARPHRLPVCGGLPHSCALDTPDTPLPGRVEAQPTRRIQHLVYTGCCKLAIWRALARRGSGTWRRLSAG